MIEVGAGPAQHTTILVAGDNASDADSVKMLLADEYPLVEVSTHPDCAALDFNRHTPEVLVLAFNSLSKAEDYYRGLLRLNRQPHPHRTVVLCRKEEVTKAYQACRKETFDDYVLFWPMNNDAPRLLMAVHHAQRELAALDQPSAAEFAAQARKLAEMGSLLDQQLQQGGQHIAAANHAMVQAEREVDEVLDGFFHKLTHGGLADVATIVDAAGLEREISRLKQHDIGPRWRVVAEAVEPIRQWTVEFMQTCKPHIESSRQLGILAQRVRETILVVDDDEFQCKTVRELLAAERYQVLFANSGLAALNMLRKLRPDLILMDIRMPDLDGIETTRRLKAMPHFAQVPVIMISGKSEGTAVRDSILAGALDFVVKPFERDTLLAKLDHALG